MPPAAGDLDSQRPGAGSSAVCDARGIEITVSGAGFTRHGLVTWPQAASWIDNGVTPARLGLVIIADRLSTFCRAHRDQLIAAGTCDPDTTAAELKAPQFGGEVAVGQRGGFGFGRAVAGGLLMAGMRACLVRRGGLGDGLGLAAGGGWRGCRRAGLGRGWCCAGGRGFPGTRGLGLRGGVCCGCLRRGRPECRAGLGYGASSGRFGELGGVLPSCVLTGGTSLGVIVDPGE